MEFSWCSLHCTCLEMGTLRLSGLGTTLPLPSCSPGGGAYTLLPEAVQEAAEDALVRAAIRVGEQHVHITTGGLSPSVGTTCHTQQPGVEGLSCFPDLGEDSEEDEGCGPSLSQEPTHPLGSKPIPGCMVQPEGESLKEQKRSSIHPGQQFSSFAGTEEKKTCSLHWMWPGERDEKDRAWILREGVALSLESSSRADRHTFSGVCPNPYTQVCEAPLSTEGQVPRSPQPGLSSPRYLWIQS